jgi:hypothetical protein
MYVIVSGRFSTYPIGRENNQRRTADLPRSALENASMNAVCGKHGKLRPQRDVIEILGVFDKLLINIRSVAYLGRAESKPS